MTSYPLEGSVRNSKHTHTHIHAHAHTQTIYLLRRAYYNVDMDI